MIGNGDVSWGWRDSATGGIEAVDFTDRPDLDPYENPFSCQMCGSEKGNCNCCPVCNNTWEQCNCFNSENELGFRKGDVVTFSRLGEQARADGELVELGDGPWIVERYGTTLPEFVHAHDCPNPVTCDESCDGETCFDVPTVILTGYSGSYLDSYFRRAANI